jgi:anti-anti-sigma regulatory factor
MGRSAVTEIAFEQRLTLSTVAADKERILSSLSDGASVVIDLAAATEVDIAFIQLIEVARRSAPQLGASLSLASPAPGPVRDVLERGGFIAGGDPELLTFWLQEESGS